jgi:pimeloyl-ACP methyl ester carboxylesterase
MNAHYHSETAAARAAEIRPFRIQVPEADLDDLRDRLARTRWPDELPDVGRDYGVPLDYVQELTDYWRRDYNWRAHEARLNQFPQFTTSIDGEALHYLHVRSPEPRALPLLITYGWPSSIVDFWHVIEPLTDPGRHGGDPADAFDVVLPSLPGFGFSGPTHDTGWNLGRHTAAMAELMRRLGYQRYGAHGGDFGSLISPALGRLDRARVVGVHVVGLLTQPPRDPDELRSLTDFERERVEKVTRWMRKGRAYALIQATRPQTLAYGLSDSPVGLLAWLTAPFTEYSDPNMPPDRDQLISNVMLYWLTGTVGSSSRLFKETGRDLASAREPSTVPTGMAVFPHDPLLPIRTVVERTQNIVHWSEFDRGGHFPAIEAPDLLVQDLRAFFRRFR